MKPKTRLYLDVDGCINAFYPHIFKSGWSGYVEEEAFGGHRNWLIRWAPGMIEKLSSLDLEVVWTTTWREYATQSIAPMIGFGEDARVLHPLHGRTTFPSINWKFDAIIKDQEESPSKFIWVEDELDYIHMEHFSDKLLIKPDSSIGVSPGEIELMKGYINE